MLPKVFGKLHPKSRAPWVAILALAVGWGLALNLGFERLVTLDIMIYGASLTLEFVALICLRIREPELKRPFRVPGGLFGTSVLGVGPMLLVGLGFWRGHFHEAAAKDRLVSALLVALFAAGPVIYGLQHWRSKAAEARAVD